MGKNQELIPKQKDELIESSEDVTISELAERHASYFKYEDEITEILNSRLGFLKDNQILTEKEFKKRGWELKDKLGIKLTEALNQIAVQHGYNSFNAIKPFLNKNKNKIINREINQEIENEKILKDTCSSFGYIYECTEENHLVQNMKNMLKEFNPIDVETDGKYVVKLKNEAVEFTSKSHDTLLNAYSEVAFEWHREYLNEQKREIQQNMNNMFKNKI